MPSLHIMPAPAFEKSLVPAFMTNFNRIRDAFARTSNRIYMDAQQTSGAWPKTFTIDHPFKADVLVNLIASCWANAVGMNGLMVMLDGAIQSNWAYHYFNEVGSHKTVGTSVLIKNVAAGIHNWGIAPASGSTTSDGNDTGTMSWTMQELSN
jgi:hypothetical protein